MFCFVGVVLEKRCDVLPLFIKRLYSALATALWNHHHHHRLHQRLPLHHHRLCPCSFHYLRQARPVSHSALQHTPFIALIIFVHLFPLTNPTRSPFPHPSTRQLTPFFSFIRLTASHGVQSSHCNFSHTLPPRTTDPHPSSIHEFILHHFHHQFLFNTCSIISLYFFLCFLLLGHRWHAKHRRVPKTRLGQCNCVRYRPSRFRRL